MAARAPSLSHPDPRPTSQPTARGCSRRALLGHASHPAAAAAPEVVRISHLRCASATPTMHQRTARAPRDPFLGCGGGLELETKRRIGPSNSRRGIPLGPEAHAQTNPACTSSDQRDRRSFAPRFSRGAPLQASSTPTAHPVLFENRPSRGLLGLSRPVASGSRPTSASHGPSALPAAEPDSCRQI